MEKARDVSDDDVLKKLADQWAEDYSNNDDPSVQFSIQVDNYASDFEGTCVRVLSLDKCSPIWEGDLDKVILAIAKAVIDLGCV